MNSPLSDRTFRRLYLAQVIALAGTGLATVALALLAYDLAGNDAGAVLGTALSIKMVANMLVALFLPRLLDSHPDRPFMLAGGILLTLGLALGMTQPRWIWLLADWFLLGAGSSLIQTPAGRLLKRSSHPNDAVRNIYCPVCVVACLLAAGISGGRLGGDFAGFEGGLCYAGQHGACGNYNRVSGMASRKHFGGQRLATR